MSELAIQVVCPRCGTNVEATYVGTYKELLRKLLQRAGIQPGDLNYKEIMDQIHFPGE